MDMMTNVTDKIEEVVGTNNRREGEVTKKIEKVTAAVPSTAWLALAGGSILAAMTLKLMGRSETANFVGQWAPTFLLLGLYNKMVKVMGSDRNSDDRRS